MVRHSFGIGRSKCKMASTLKRQRGGASIDAASVKEKFKIIDTLKRNAHFNSRLILYQVV